MPPNWPVWWARLTSYLPSALITWSIPWTLAASHRVVALAVVAVGPGTCTEAAVQKTSQALTSRLETLRQPICGGRSF